LLTLTPSVALFDIETSTLKCGVVSLVVVWEKNAGVYQIVE
jgi:hypothetical protein